MTDSFASQPDGTADLQVPAADDVPAPAGSGVSDQVLRVRGLTKRYGDKAVVDDVSIDVPRGTVFGLLGPNGAGKTTTIRMILGLARCDAGEIELMGVNRGDPGYTRVLHRVGSMIEEPAHWKSLTGRRNLEIHARYLGVADAAARIDEVLGIVGLAGREQDRVRKYSQGMRQRLGIAVALLGRPDLIILDEPSNGLDPAGIVEMRSMIRGLPARGVSVVLSSHLLAEVQLACDHVAIVNQGAIVAAGPTDEVIRRYGAAGRIVVEVDPADRPGALDALAAAGLAARLQTDGTIDVDAGAEVTGRHVSYALAQRNVWAESITRAGASLEDVFLSLTGGLAAAGRMSGVAAPRPQDDSSAGGG